MSSAIVAAMTVAIGIVIWTSPTTTSIARCTTPLGLLLHHNRHRWRGSRLTGGKRIV